MHTRNIWTRLAACALLAAAATAHAETPAKPHAPSWKYRTNHMQVDVGPDGSSTVKYELSYTVLAESALHSMSEQEISYHEHDGSLEDVVAYTLKKDGSRIDVPASNVQVTSRNGINGTAPAFSDFMSRRLVFPDVEVGDSVVLSYTLKDLRPTFKQHYSLLTNFSDTYVYDDASVTVTAPKSLGLSHKTYNLDPPKVTSVGGERRQWHWIYRNPVARDTRAENSQYERAWHYRELPSIQLSNFADYRQIAAAYEQQAAPRAAVNERIRKLATQIVGDAPDRREQAARIYRWVAKEISFAGNCLTGGDVVPRETELILNMKMGDCKDHATLMQALLAAQGIKSTQVLVNTREMGYEVPDVPCWQAFNHVFNYLPEFDVYADATSTFNPFGTLPEQDRGKIVIHTATYDGLKHTPMRGTDANFSEATDAITISPDGSIEVTSKYRLGGDLANGLSKHFHDWKQSPDFDGGGEYIKRAIESMGYHGDGSYLDFPDVAGPADDFGYTINYHVLEYFDTGDPHGVDLNPLFPTPSPISGLMQFAATPDFGHDFLCHGDRRSEELSMTFPANVHLLAVPRDVHAKTPLLDFDATYVREGNTIRVKRSVVDRTPGPVCSADVAEQYARIASAIKKDGKAQAVYAPVAGDKP